MKKYLYNLYGKKGEYTLKEIAKELDLDLFFLKDALEEKHGDIDLACMAAYSEVNKKKAMANILNLYTTRYICSYNINELINNQLELKSNKRRFLNTITYISNCNDSEYIMLNKKSLNTLLVNTEDDINKKVISEDKLNAIKSLKAIVETDKDTYYSLHLNNDNKLYSIRKDFNDDSVGITVGDTKKLVDCLSKYKLPCSYNVIITEELINDMHKSDSKSNVYAYVKK